MSILEDHELNLEGIEHAEAPVLAEVADRPEPTPSRPTRISNEDRLAAENLQLRHVCSLQRIQLLQAQMLNVSREIDLEQAKAQGFQADMDTLKASIAVRYQLDFGKYQIREADGVIIPIG